MASKLSITLPTGQPMPALGFGTWQANDAELETALDLALEAGYRHIDTATVYENENVIGKVLKKWMDTGKITRSELFIVTKVPPSGNRSEDIEKWIKKSLKALQLDYIDLYLIHTPFSFMAVGDDMHPVNQNGEILIDPNTDHIKVWAEMENQVMLGRTKAIGLSNFNIDQINEILKTAKVPISNLQIELHLYFQQKELVKFCQNNNIPVTAYSPLGSRGLVKILQKIDVYPDILSNDVLLEIAVQYKKTPAQVALKHILQKGIAAIPKSTNPRRIWENIQMFDWKLEPDDVSKLDALDLGATARICNFGFLKGIERHPKFPF
ncbi:hypothetical protein KM043_000552 [Ampulex compressa]|nr:hypothetical protein KM043_000552 [Ampulex compressa]